MGRYGATLKRVGVGVALFAVFALGVGIAGAQRDGGPTRQGPPGVGRGPFGQEFVEKLAGNLGVTEDALRSALQQTREQLRPQMEERMRQFRERMGDRWQHGRDGGRGPMGLRGQGPMGGPMILSSAAQVLGMDADSLRAELQSGKTLAQVGQEHGVQPDALADQIVQSAEQARPQQMRDAIRRMIDQPFARPNQPPVRTQ